MRGLNRTFQSILSALAVMSLLLSVSPVAFAQGGQPARPDRPLPEWLAELKLAEPATMDIATAGLAKLNPQLVDATGRRQVVVRLDAPSAAQTAALTANVVTVQSEAQAVVAQQDGVLGYILSVDPTVQVLGRLKFALNALLLDVDAAALPAIAANSSVIAINPVVNYELDLSETVPYIGARAPNVVSQGKSGQGIKVAVLDSGIDYTHAEFGGAGTAAAYEAAYGTSTADARNTTLDGLFPTARVVGGYDFVGEVWPRAGVPGGGPLNPDPDPIDCGPAAIPAPCAGGHGSHVADIIGGALGVAPKVDLYAVKVCSSVSTACSGVALLQGIDFAIDPNGDGNPSDHVNLINMSLGSDYGDAYNDDLSVAVNNATNFNILTVAASGNGGNRPYVSGTPAAAFTALSVAQTHVPSSTRFQLRVNSPAGIAGLYPNTETVGWAPITTGFTGDIAFVGRGCPAGSIDGTNPDDPYLANPAGKVALIDRGACAVSLKVDRAAKAGAIAVLVGLVASGDPISFSFGGGDTFVQTMIIQQSLSNAIKANLGGGVNVSVLPADGIPQVGTMVGSSSRGPNPGAMFFGNDIMYGQLIKPEIGAPGASVSAEAGTGVGATAFGGTSGATPMVTGSAALLLNSSRFLGRLEIGPLELKSLLMNNAETNIFTRPTALGGALAPITRIGGGEVRVDRAVASPSAAWEFNDRTGALSFGFVDVTKATTRLTRTVVVHNYSNKTITYNITPSFRFANDVTNGAVDLSTPPSVRVPARSERTFRVTLTIDGAKLRQWGLNSGSQGANGPLLDTFEYDGYVTLNDPNTAATDDLHLAWQVLPRQSGDVRPSEDAVEIDDTTFGFPSGEVDLRNRGIGTARVDAYSLIGTSPIVAAAGAGQNRPPVDLKAIGIATYFDGCDVGDFAMSFVFTTHYRQTHANAPAEFDVFLDTNQDGTADYDIFNFDLSLSSSISDGRNLTWVADLTTGVATAFFFTDHGLNSGNTILTICASQIGLPNYFQPMTADFVAFDWYNGNGVTDEITGLTISPLGERYLGLGATDIPSGDTQPLTVLDFGPVDTNPTETGLLLVLDASRGGGIRGGAPSNNETILLTVEP